MKTNFLFLILIVFVCISVDAQTVTFQKTLGGVNTDSANAVKQTNDGGYIIIGSTASSGAGGMDVYLVKTDDSGNLLWTKTFGGTSNDYGKDVYQTNDGGYIIAAETYSFSAGGLDIYLLKTDGGGNLLWSKKIGGAADDFANSVQQTNDGGYILTGITFSYGAGHDDVYLIKTDGSGNISWTKTYGGSDYEDGYSVSQTTDGGYIITGVTSSYGQGGYDILLLKTDGSGNVQWSKAYGGASNDEGYNVRQTTDGGYIIAGRTNSFGVGNYDIMAIKTDASGSVSWMKTYGGTISDYGYGVQQTNDGGYAITGVTGSFGVAINDAYLIKTDVSGNVQWSKTYGGSDFDWGVSFRQTNDFGYIIAGFTMSFSSSTEVYLIRNCLDFLKNKTMCINMCINI